MLRATTMAAALSIAVAATAAQAAAETTELVLGNGLGLVVIEDHRAPVVTHVIGYRAGAIDEPAGKSGVAHFVEHMLFKAAAARAAGDYARLVARHGGSSNAVTTHDATIYHARVPKAQLGLVMQLEAERMQSVRIDDADVEAERGVILAERRGRIDGVPLNVLAERIDQAMYGDEGYGAPAIGRASDVRAIGRIDVERFYRRHYTPAAAFVVVAGDVTPDEVRRLAEATYGAIPAASGGYAPPRPAAALRPAGDPARRVTLSDARVANPVVYRVYDVPSRQGGNARAAAALEVMAAMLTSGASSVLSEALVVRDGVAVGVDGGYLSLRRGGGQLALYAVATPGRQARDVELALDAAIAAFVSAVPADAAVARAKAAIATRMAYEADSQLDLARHYAEALAAGSSAAEIAEWPARIRSVSAVDIRDAARRFLAPERAVTGILSPAAPHSEGARAP